MTKIGIISDTHGLLRSEVIEILKNCDYILHAGDINTPALLSALKDIAPLHIVRGNNDKEWAESIPENVFFKIEDVSFFMVHNKKEVPSDLGDVNIVVFGHSHKYFEKEIDGRLWLNPGSCGKRRFNQEISMAVMTVDGNSYNMEKVIIPHTRTTTF